jgi:hypothetical protein
MIGLALGVYLTAAVAMLPGVQPQLAESDGRVYLVYGQGDTIHVARSDDAGETFGAPVRLPTTGKLSLGRHRGPRIVALGSTVLVTATAGMKGGGADGNLLLFRSADMGKTWLAPIVINDVPNVAREGLHAMAATPSGVVIVAWLDLRGGTSNQLYAAVSRDRGATWGADALVYRHPTGGGVCECCHPSLAVDGTGQAAVMFRNNLDGNRDMYVARATAQGTFAAPTKVGTGSWLLNACPMDGGGVAFTPSGLVSAWRREGDVYLSTPQMAELKLAAGRDPAIGTYGSSVDIAWTGANGIMLKRGDAAPVLVAPGGFASVLSLPAKTVLAWEDQNRVHVRTFVR